MSLSLRHQSEALRTSDDARSLRFQMVVRRSASSVSRSCVAAAVNLLFVGAGANLPSCDAGVSFLPGDAVGNHLSCDVLGIVLPYAAVAILLRRDALAKSQAGGNANGAFGAARPRRNANRGGWSPLKLTDE
eukprot:scaffold1299_cov246-Pinguiococcus_pyrenoidosus.AAC.3